MKISLSSPSSMPILKGRKVVIDTETTGLNKMVHKPFLVQLGIGEESFALRWDEQTVNFLTQELLSRQFFCQCQKPWLAVQHFHQG